MRKFHSFTDITEALAAFVPTPRQYDKARFSLEDMKRLLDFLGNPQDKLKIIHIAGTSGKTSTSYYVTSFLKAAGCKVGLTVSPHVDEINERTQINLKPISEESFCKEFAIFLDEVDASGIKPSYFALMVAFAYWLFAKEKVDYAVVEVGMGGVLDATNVTNNPDKVCVITDIGLDHTEYLGDTLAEITSQKAGIVRPHNTVFSYAQDEEVMDVLREVCRQQQAELHEVWPFTSAELPKNMPLFQRRNWYLAWSVFSFVTERDMLKEMGEEELSATTRTYIPARMETIERGGKIIIMDGAHNAHKLSALAKSIAAAYPGKEVAVLFSIAQSGGGRAKLGVAAVTKFAKHLVLTTFKATMDAPKVSVNPRKMAEYCDRLDFADYEIVRAPDEAVEALLKRPEDILLIAGSFYLLDNVRPLIMEKK